MRKLLFFIIGLLLLSLPSFAQITSNGTGGGEWSNTSTWAGNVIPTSSDDAIIANGDVVTVSSAGNTCKKLTVNSGGELKVTGGDLSTGSTGDVITGTLTVTGGTYNANTSGRTLTIDGMLTFSGGTINVSGRFIQSSSGSSSLSGAAILNVNTKGQKNISGEIFRITGSSNSFSVTAGSTVQIVLKYGNAGAGTEIYYSPGTSNFDGGSIIVENGSGLSTIRVDSDEDIYKIESKVGSGKTLNFLSGCYFDLEDLTLTSGSASISDGARISITSSSLGADDNLILESGASVKFTNQPSEKVQVQRYIEAYSDASHGWHFLSSPVDNFTISGSDFEPTSGDDDLYEFNEPASTDNWYNYNGGSFGDTYFVTGKGYLVAYKTSQTKTFSGLVNVSNVNYSNLSYTAGAPFQGWHLLGNPFQSALRWDNNNSSINWNLSNIDGTLKIWDETNASYTDIADEGFIPPLNGFMVHVTSGTNTIRIPKGGRRHKNTAIWLKNTTADSAKTIVLKVVDVDGQTAQKNKIIIKEDATNGFDSQYDSRFLAGYAPQFYAISGEDKLSTIALPELTSENDIIYGFIKNSAAHFYIQIEGLETLTPMENLYLTDLLTNHTQLLNENPTYEFTAGDNDPEIRFKLHFTPLGVNENINIKPFNIFNVGNRIEIRSNKMVNAKIKVYNITGQLVKTDVMNNQTSLSIDINTPQGIYIVSVISNDKTQNQKIILN